MSVWSLWLPILLSGLATHIMSTVAWMALPHHKKDFGVLPDEDDFDRWLNDKGVPAGQYVFPAPEHMGGKKGSTACRGMLMLWPTPPNMGAAIGKTLAFFFVAAFSIGYLASIALPAGASAGEVFRFVGTAGLLTHCYGIFPGLLWFPRKVSTDLIDKVAYALVTALLFTLLWPSEAVAN